MNHGIQGFIDDLTRLGFNPTVDAGLVIYRIAPVEGAHAGVQVETGVSADELAPWPQAPPHWVHLPASIGFPETNIKASTKPDWLKHSRDIIGWGDAPPEIWWTSHIRAVLGEATA
jgi:hypothetical protein